MNRSLSINNVSPGSTTILPSTSRAEPSVSDDKLSVSARFNVKDLFKNKNRVTINVGGSRHEVMWKTLERMPTSRLGRIRFAKSMVDLQNLCDLVNLEEDEIFFDQHAASFDCVLNFLRTGKLHLIENMCVLSFHEDLAYWGIEECFLENCCHLRFHQRKDALLEELKREEENGPDGKIQEQFDRCFPSFRKRVWDLMEHPQTSKAARVRNYILFDLKYF